MSWTLMSNVNGVSLVNIDNFKFSTKRFIFLVYGSLTMYNCTVDSSFVKMYLERNENEPILEYEVGNPIQYYSGQSNVKFIKTTIVGNKSPSFYVHDTWQGKSADLYHTFLVFTCI